MRPVRLLSLLLALPLAAAGMPAHARYIEVRVHDDAGVPVPGQPVRLVRLPAGEMFPTEQQGLGLEGTPWRESDETGRVVFEGLAAGAWAAVPRLAPEGPFMWNNLPPDADSARATLRGDSDAAALDVVLRRGTHLRFRLVSEQREEMEGQVLRLSAPPGSGYLDRVSVTTARDAVRTLTPGRSTFRLLSPRATPAVAADLDGVAVGPEEVTVELSPGGRERVLTWRLAAPATLEGRLQATRPIVGVEVQATLVAPGPVTAEILARGLHPFRVITTAPRPEDGAWSTAILDGTWRIAPVGRLFRAARPPFRELTIAAGQTVRAEFEVDLDEERPASLVVRVMSSQQRLLPQAAVRVRRAGEAGGAPVAEGLSDEASGSFVVRGLAPGDYRVEAAHEEGGRGEVEVRGFAPGREPRLVLVELGRGVNIAVRAVDPGGVPVPGVVLVLQTRRPAAPGDDSFAEHLNGPRYARTDATGWASYTGLEPGEVEIAAAVHRPDTLVRWKDSGARGIRRNVQADQDQELELRVVPAAVLAARLVCDDVGEFGEGLEFAAVPAGGTSEQEEEWIRDFIAGTFEEGGGILDRATQGPPATIPASEERLKEASPRGGALSKEGGAIRVSPLVAGSYWIALRPWRFDRWTWVPGGEDPNAASPYAAVEGETADLGAVTLGCAPRVALAPSGSPIPDLRPASVRASVVTVPGGGAHPIPVQRWTDRVDLGPLPAGKVTVRAVLCRDGEVNGVEGAESCRRNDRIVGLPVSWSREFDLRRGAVAAWTPAWPESPRDPKGDVE